MDNKQFFSLLLIACLFFLAIADGFSASDIQKMKAIPIPAGRLVEPSGPLTVPGERLCVIQCDENSLAMYYPYADTGDGYVLYMDPEMCDEEPYPFKIIGVQLYLRHFTNGITAVWPVEVLVNIKRLDEDTLCLGKPGTVLYHQIFSVPIDSSYDSLGRPMNLSLDSLTTPTSTSCVDTSFFLELIFTGGTAAPFPSLIMSDSSLDFPDTCHAWFLREGEYYEWSEIWHPPNPGCPIMRMIGYTNSMDCYPCWYWKPTTASSPSGMPDFDQYQFGDSSALDVPAAVANCLWRVSAVPEDTSSPDLIRLLSTHFYTDPHSGTIVDSAQAGLNRYFADYGFDLDAQIYLQPDFYEMADSLRRQQSIVLSLGLWQSDGDFWRRFGGHAVVLAGVCSDSSWVAISDPAVDGAELAWQGRFFPPGHPHHADDDTLHNNPMYVSHDIYVTDPSFDIDDDTLWMIQDFFHADTSLFRRFEGRNFQPGQTPYSYDPSKAVYAVAEYAIMICPKPTSVGQEEVVMTPEDFELFQNHPNPFNNETIIKYNLSKSGHVSLEIYNILGQKVKTLVKGFQQGGVKTADWDGKDEKGEDLSSGIYFYQLKVGEITQTKRMVLLK